MRSIIRLAPLLAVLALSSVARGDGWKFWKSSTPAQRPDGTVGGAPHMSGAPLSTPSSSWSVGKTWSSVQSGTKKAWNKTVDVVTLKPLRTPKPQNDFKLGMHPDPRREPEQKSWFSNPFGSKESAQPRTTDEFFSQPRLR